MINFFIIVLIIFIGILLLVFKKRSLKKFINKSNFNSVKSNRINKFSSNKNVQSFKGNTENKLKALKIAEELADKSTLPILRKGLRDISPEVVEISALLIRKFK